MNTTDPTGIGIQVSDSQFQAIIHYSNHKFRFPHLEFPGGHSFRYGPGLTLLIVQEPIFQCYVAINHKRKRNEIYMHVYIKVYKDNILEILAKCFQYTHTYLFAIYTDEKRNFKCQHVILLFTEANSQTPSYPDVKIKKKKNYLHWTEKKNLLDRWMGRQTFKQTDILTNRQIKKQLRMPSIQFEQISIRTSCFHHLRNVNLELELGDRTWEQVAFDNNFHEMTKKKKTRKIKSKTK